MFDILLQHIQKDRDVMLELAKRAPAGAVACLVAALASGILFTSAWDGRVIRGKDADIEMKESTIQWLQTHGASKTDDADKPQETDRRLDRQQRINLTQLLVAHHGDFPVICIFSMQTDEARRYAGEFREIFESIGIKVVSREFVPMGETDVGLMIGVPNMQKPSNPAKELFDIFNKASLPVHFTSGGTTDLPNLDYDLFIGPKPW